VASRREYGSFESHHPKQVCPDCGGQMTHGSKRCRKCWAKQAPFAWKPCLTCDEKIRGASTRCRSCYDTDRIAARRYCAGECGAVLPDYGPKRCWDCELKRRKERPERRCSVEGCLKKNDARGLCSSHYQQQYRPRRRGEHRGNTAKQLLSRWPCQLCCYDRLPCDVHRLIPGPQGGTYRPPNIVALCVRCHREVHRGIAVAPEPPTEADIRASHPNPTPRTAK